MEDYRGTPRDQAQEAPRALSARIGDAARDFARAVRSRYTRISPIMRTRISLAAKTFLFAGVFVALILQMRTLDWAKISTALPTSPWFYAIFLIRYLSFPLIEIACYSIIFGRALFRNLGVFLQKQVLNFSIMELSGDAFFALWSVRRLGVSAMTAALAVKDVTILSAAAANTLAVFVLGAYAVFGDGTLERVAGPEITWIVVGSTLAAALVSIAIFVFRGRVLSLSTRKAAEVFGLHLFRVTIGMPLLAYQWSAGLPGTPLSAWFTFLILDLLISRTPFLPGKQFLFVALGIELAGLVDAPREAVAALFLVNAALTQAVAFLSFLIGSAMARRDADTSGSRAIAG